MKDLLTSEEVQGTPEKPLSQAEVIQQIIELDGRLKQLKREIESATSRMDELKKQAMDMMIQLGVNQLKGEKTIYLHSQYWAGTAEGIDNLAVSDALRKLDLGSFVSYNHQSLSGYVREEAKKHKGLLDKKGQIVASEEEILKVLPPPLNTLLKVTKKTDIRVRS